MISRSDLIVFCVSLPALLGRFETFPKGSRWSIAYYRDSPERKWGWGLNRTPSCAPCISNRTRDDRICNESGSKCCITHNRWKRRRVERGVPVRLHFTLEFTLRRRVESLEMVLLWNHGAKGSRSCGSVLMGKKKNVRNWRRIWASLSAGRRQPKYVHESMACLCLLRKLSSGKHVGFHCHQWSHWEPLNLTSTKIII